MDELQIASLIIWITMLPYPIFMVVFYQNRFIHPIKGRYPRVSLLECMAIFLFGSNQCFYTLFNYPCKAWNMGLFLTSCIIQAAFNYRLVQLLFNYELTQNIAELKEKKNLKDWSANWFTRHRWLAKNKFIFQVAVILTIIYLILVISMNLLSESICGLRSWSYMFTTKGTIGAGFSIFLAIKMWHFPNDAFGLKHEFKLRTATPIVITVCFELISMINPRLQFIVTLGLILACHPLLFFALIPPYFRSRRELAVQQVSGLNELSSLENWLKRPDGIRCFLSYLKTEFSSENLLFYLDVIYFKSLSRTDIPGLKYYCEQIFNKFLDNQSPGQVNISAEISDNTTKNVQTFLNAAIEVVRNMKDEEIFGIFDEAQAEIYRLMASDSFFRFQRTSEFERVKSLVLKQTPNRGQESKSVDQVLGSPDPLKIATSFRDEELDQSFQALSRSQSEADSPLPKESYCALVKVPEDQQTSSAIQYSQLPQVDPPETPNFAATIELEDR